MADVSFQSKIQTGSQENFSIFKTEETGSHNDYYFYEISSDGTTFLKQDSVYNTSALAFIRPLFRPN